MRQLSYLTILLALIVTSTSCDRVKNKTERVAEKAKVELKEQAQKVIDKVYPPFDHDKADTENNKNRFKDFIKVVLTPDVKNIYCFDDAIGIDADYMFAFSCNAATSEKIIERHQLSMDTTSLDNGFAIQHDFEWWDKKSIKKLQKYSWNQEGQYFKYFWYNEKLEKAYFFDFTL